ncbi:hypothetical protein PG985_012220 [Apiospora marii]|uniref:Uncharacterized protein n=1 Tax=Apiospora marii TaxID=335849 RepID=A0ABR1RDX8_9PEZI
MYDEKEPGSRYFRGSQVYGVASAARTKLMKYNETVERAHLLISMHQSTYEKLAELKKEMLRLDRALEECQRRLRAREAEDTKKQDEVKRQNEDSLTPFMIPGSDPREHDGWGHGGGLIGDFDAGVF